MKLPISSFLIFSLFSPLAGAQASQRFLGDLQAYKLSATPNLEECEKIYKGSYCEVVNRESPEGETDQWNSQNDIYYRENQGQADEVSVSMRATKTGYVIMIDRADKKQLEWLGAKHFIERAIKSLDGRQLETIVYTPFK